MNVANLWHLTKQGDVAAIATLINQALTRQRVTVQAKLRQGCLEFMLTAANAPSISVFTCSPSVFNALRNSIYMYKFKTGTPIVVNPFASTNINFVY